MVSDGSGNKGPGKVRDPELMLALLRQMAREDSGELHLNALGQSTNFQKYRHHLILLVDAGHAQWETDHRSLPIIRDVALRERSVARITNDGYDFLNAVDQGESYRLRFIKLFQDGVPYVKAAIEVVNLVGKASGG